VLADLEIYPEALRHFDQSYEIHKSLGNQLNTGYSLLGRGDMLWRLGRAPEAREALKQIPAITDRLDGKYKQALTVRVHLVNSQMALSERRFSEAKVQAGHALALAGTQVRRAEIEAKYALGLAQALSGEKREGNRTCDAAVEMAKQWSDPRLLSNALLALAEAQFENGKTQEAMSTVLQAQERFARSSQPEAECRAWFLAARISQSLKNIEAARQQLSNASALLNKLQQKWGDGAFNHYRARPDVQFNRQQLDKGYVSSN
jgi:tetratricopeptide (TPR) repeat protein